MTNDHNQMRDWGVGAGSGLTSAILGWLKPLGDAASSIGAIATCIISLVMLYRLIRAGKPNQKPKDTK